MVAHPSRSFSLWSEGKRARETGYIDFSLSFSPSDHRLLCIRAYSSHCCRQRHIADSRIPSSTRDRAPFPITRHWQCEIPHFRIDCSVGSKERNEEAHACAFRPNICVTRWIAEIAICSRQYRYVLLKQIKFFLKFRKMRVSCNNIIMLT